MANFLDAINAKLQRWSFTRGQQQAFLEDFSSLIEDGVPATQAIQTIGQIVKGSQYDVAMSIQQKISEGKLIADGMQGWFPQPIIEIIRAGEEGGTLALSMMAASRALSQESKAMTAFLSAITYPLTVLVMGLAVAVFIKHSVFVNFADIKPVDQWPANGQVLMNVAGFVENWWWAIILLIIALIIIIARVLRDVTGPTRTFLDSLPLFSLYRDVMAARFMETLGLLLTNGIVLKKALTIMRQKATSYVAWHIYTMEFRLSGGRENIAEVIQTGLIAQYDILRLRVIAKGKGFEHALVRLGQLAAERNAKRIALVSKIAGGVLLGIGALWAAFMIFAIYGVGSFVGSA